MPDPIDAAALEARGVRSGGPGGQNVNKVASKAELLVDLALVEGLDEGARLRLAALAEGRRDAEGRLRVTAGRAGTFTGTSRRRGRRCVPSS
ncbi:MAG: hypothetical protein IPN03_15700 [Holophagales bacterium]|nr:hypothetical protein [Holophagales bacterium]